MVVNEFRAGQQRPQRGRFLRLEDGAAGDGRQRREENDRQSRVEDVHEHRAAEKRDQKSGKGSAPAIEETWNADVLHITALLKCSRGTICGRKAARVGC